MKNMEDYITFLSCKACRTFIQKTMKSKIDEKKYSNSILIITTKQSSITSMSEDQSYKSFHL